MRTIKFRAQDIASNKWLYGDIRHHKNDVCIFEQGGNRGEQVKPETVGQFTGLYDRSGREIYEGDIIAGEIDMETINGNYEPVDYCEGVVTFENGKFVENEYGTDLEFLMRQSNKPKVIGNIHDNKSLIEKGE